MGGHKDGAGENGTLTGKACPEGLYGVFCEVTSQYLTILMLLCGVFLVLGLC